VEKEFAVYLSYDWGGDSHKKVKYIASLFDSHGLKSWMNDSNNRDNVEVSSVEGIRKCHFFVLFLTASFNEKIKREEECVFRELNYAAYSLSPKKIVVVVLEKEMARRENWADVLLLLLASNVYFDLSEATTDGDNWDYVHSYAWLKLLETVKRSQYDSLGVSSADSGI
jgi:hypothetical protein